MEFIKGITFCPFCHRGQLSKYATKESLCNLKERTGANLIILVPAGYQETPQSTEIDFESFRTCSDEELINFIKFAHSIDLKIALKPTVNCKNGVWRAHINFFDIDVHCEPKWSDWFSAYEKFQLHYAKIAEETGCEMFIAGCEMVNTETRDGEWRNLISKIREVYNGPVSYNTDKYQEGHVKWWDCVDIISSSGYYPINDWEKELDRIEEVVKKYNKPFFFAETGCMSVTGSSKVPNDWSVRGDINTDEQARWYEAMFESSLKRDWFYGFGLWAWNGRYHEMDAKTDGGYDIYAKPAEKVVCKYFKTK